MTSARAKEFDRCFRPRRLSSCRTNGLAPGMERNGDPATCGCASRPAMPERIGFAGSSLGASIGANFDLWHIEDEARTPGATDAELAEVKRRIDSHQPARNDLAEELDRACWRGSSRGPAQSRGAAALRVAGADDRPALDSGAEDLSHARRGGAARARPTATRSAIGSGSRC